MTLSNQLSSYADVQIVFDKAIELQGGKYRFQTRGDAVRWRQRAYKFRKLLDEQPFAANPYRDLVLRLTKDPSDTTVEITIGHVEGEFLDPKGKKVKLPKKLVEEIQVDDTLFDEAKKLAEELGK